MREKSVTTLLMLSVAGLVGYYFVARAVSRRATTAEDRKLRDDIQKTRDAGGSKVAEAIGPIGKEWLHIPAAAILSGSLLRQGIRTRAFVPLIASVTSETASRLFDRLPPNRKPPPGHPNQKKPSFPSSHANETTAVAFTSAYVLSREGLVEPVPAFAIASVLAIASPASRMYLDRHWSTDVVAGWMLGGSIAAACAALYEGSNREGHREIPF